MFLPRGESTSVQSHNVVASCWLDRKTVTVMSTSYDPAKIDMEQEYLFLVPLPVQSTWGGVLTMVTSSVACQDEV